MGRLLLGLLVWFGPAAAVLIDARLENLPNATYVGYGMLGMAAWGLLLLTASAAAGRD